jgi:probable rRNA maturation factor
MKIQIELARDNREWYKHKNVNKFLMTTITSHILNKFDKFKTTCQYELSILLTMDDKMLHLNNLFRNKNSVTNVLSFPDINLNYRQLLEFEPNVEYMYLGDIAFGYQKIRNEAKDQNKTFEHHFIHLLVHSILHLLGFDHQAMEDAIVMENLEIEILKDFNIINPYQ